MIKFCIIKATSYLTFKIKSQITKLKIKLTLTLNVESSVVGVVQSREAATIHRKLSMRQLGIQEQV